MISIGTSWGCTHAGYRLRVIIGIGGAKVVRQQETAAGTCSPSGNADKSVKSTVRHKRALRPAHRALHHKHVVECISEVMDTNARRRNLRPAKNNMNVLMIIVQLRRFCSADFICAGTHLHAKRGGPDRGSGSSQPRAIHRRGPHRLDRNAGAAPKLPDIGSSQAPNIRLSIIGHQAAH